MHHGRRQEKAQDRPEAKGNLGDHWSTSAIEPVISVSAKLDFVEGMIDIMPNGNDKETVTSILEDKTFPFAYDVRTTPQGEFPDSGRIDIKAFKQDSKVAVEMQIHSRNFKTKATDGTGLGYLFRLVGVYKLEDVRLLPVSTPEKRRRGANEWIATPPRTKKTCAALNPLEWVVGKDNGGDAN